MLYFLVNFTDFQATLYIQSINTKCSKQINNDVFLWMNKLHIT